MEESNKMREMIDASLSNIKTLLDANTIIGDPIVTESGTTIIPVSKISVGYVSGGLDYNKKKGEKDQDKNAPANFGGGGGTGISVSPVAFIVINGEGKAEMLNIASSGSSDAASQIVNLVDRSPEIIEKIKGIFKKKDKDNTK
ncbi:MAG: sporulation protein YtfJ [Clostridia bacterium]|nr:sporulation protein YtfJ [Clostridia bacterium]MBQ6676900.1 sporulation protein YtfJ [Clostridia bacterium]